MGFRRFTLVSAVLLVNGCDGGKVEVDPPDVDVTPPAVSATTPEDGATDVARDAQLLVVFSEALDPTSVNSVSLTLNASSGAIAATVAYDDTSQTASLTPLSSLVAQTTYTATVSAEISDTSGNNMAEAYRWSFTTAATADTTPPSVVSSSPADGSTGVPVNTAIAVLFSESIAPASVTVSELYADGGITGSVSVSGATATYTPDADLPPSTTVTMTLAAGVEDLAGNATTQATVWSFTTGSSADTTPPTVVSTEPASSQADVELDATISVVFSEPLDAATVDASSFTISPGSGTVAVSGSSATLTPDGSLTPGTVYTVTLSTTITDLAGNQMAAEYVWTFTTADDLTAALSWIAPTTEEDGVTPLTDLAGYKIYSGTTSRHDAAFTTYDDELDVGNSPICSANGSGEMECTHVMHGFTSGTTIYFTVSAYDTSDNESDYSNEASKSF
jgi:methionine-rich copper-binding protein CopC